MAGFLVLPGSFLSLEKTTILQFQPDLGQHLQALLPITATLFHVSGLAATATFGEGIDRIMYGSQIA